MSASKTWIIGSSPECDIVVTKNSVSRRHCRLNLKDGRYYLKDLKSTNGTFKNGEPVSGEEEVTLEDRIVLGSDVPFPWPDELRHPV